jgi:hypothetical protein
MLADSDVEDITLDNLTNAFCRDFGPGEMMSGLLADEEETAESIFSLSFDDDDEDEPVDSGWDKLASLPQYDNETWETDIQQAAQYIEIEEDRLRPWLLAILETGGETIVAIDMSPDEPSADWLVKGVRKALRSPMVGEPHRPGKIHVASRQQRELLAPYLKKLGIKCAARANLRRVHRVINDAGEFLGGSLSQRGALVNAKDVTLPQMGSLFEAAAQYWRARPWRLADPCIISVSSNRFSGGPWYAVVMGQAGVEPGLALYDDFDLVRSMMTGEMSEIEAIARTKAIAMTYGDTSDLAPEDVVAAKENGWEVAGPKAYPCILKLRDGLPLDAPASWELELLEGCLRALPEFLKQKIGKAETEVTLSSGSAAFELELLDGG